MDGLIVNVALTGCVHDEGPLTPGAVALDAKRCWDAGASMFHLHARDWSGKPTWGENRYREYVEACRDLVPDAVLVVSCSGRQGWGLEERAGAIRSGADMASLTTGSFNFRDAASVNPPDVIKGLAERMKKWGVKPEIECFDLGHVFNALKLIEEGLVDPAWFNLFLGNELPAEREYLHLMASRVPSPWAGAGIGKAQWDANRWAIEAGGHVRVGLEDSLWMSKGDRATNPRMVERAVAYGLCLGREPVNARRVLFGQGD